MSLLRAASVADDRVLAASWTSARQLRQADLSYPGSALSSVHGNAIKRITAGVKARRWSHRQVRSGDWAFTLLSRTSVERKKNECIGHSRLNALTLRLAGYWRPEGINPVFVRNNCLPEFEMAALARRLLKLVYER